MSTKAPQVLSRKANGVSSASEAQSNEPTKRNGNDNSSNAPRSNKGRGASGKHGDTTKTPNEGETSRPARSRPQNEGEKLVIRRLPPGMTQSEFLSILGPDWEAGKGKVDWLSFAAGKLSNDLSKPSRPGRAYIHLMRKDDIMPLSEVVRTSTWEDAKGTFTSASLIAPPALELCIYKKVASNKKRSDARQGTIDQDPEFMAFLEELANPTPSKENIKPDDGDDLMKTEAKITTTPLVEYLKEKKANKHKDGASGKNAKGKGKGAARDDESSKKKGKDGKNDKSEKSNKETVKILTKKEATEQAAEAAKNAAAQIGASNATDNPKNRRAGIAAAARILQRDLGLSPGSAHRRARQEHAKTGPDAKATTSKEAVETTTERPESPAQSETASQTSKGQAAAPTAPKSQSSSRRARGGKNADKGKAAEGQSSAPPANPPMILKKKGDGEGTPAAADPATQQSSTAGKPAPASSAPKAASSKAGSQKKPSITPNATRSFVKHANTSQGVTEAALKQALETFGSVTFIEIDKRKGFAYVDFADPESLVQAANASPISVAQGAVQVLERKDKKPAPSAATSSAAGASAPEKGSGSGPSRGRRGRGGGKGVAAAGAQAPAASASASTGGPG